MIDLDLLQDDGVEPFYTNYKAHLEQLNQILRQSGEFIEGNNFYLDGVTPAEEQMPVVEFRIRRRAHVLLAQQYDRVVEVGFNAGHSALLLLTANPDLIYTGIDICTHGYTSTCYEYLKSVFGDRVRLTKGNSVEQLPLLYSIYPDLKDKSIGWIIDGCHLIDIAKIDAYNVVEVLANDGELLLFDDIDAYPGHIKQMMETYVQQGNLTVITEMATPVENVGSYPVYTFIQGLYKINKFLLV